MQMTESPAEILKRSAALSHASTEKALIQYVKNISSVEDYANLLYCLYGFYQPLEKTFDALLSGNVPEYANRRKSGRLLQDISQLGYPAPKRLASQLPAMTDTITTLGCFYVIEGSALGGAVMKKMIHAKCEQIPEQAFSFLSGYGNTMELWRSFLAYLNEALHTEKDLQTAITAANDCFSQFEKWIKEYYQVKDPV
jgi:heme oxygenase